MIYSNQIIVSIIIPVYNMEKYIYNCIRSITLQDYKNIEIIIINDGSTDNSGVIINSFLEKDNRIKIINKINSGVSSARNTGLNVASGDYILFIDADDYIDKNYVSYFLELVIKNNCPVGMNINNYRFFNIMKSFNFQDRQLVIDSLTAANMIYYSKIFVAVWNKIYSRSFLIENKITFNTDLFYGEGLFFNMQCLQYANKIAVGQKRVYHQVFNPNSAMRLFNLESNHCGIRSMKLQKELWETSGKFLYVKNAWEYHYICFSYRILSGIIQYKLEKIYRQEMNDCIKSLKGSKKLFLKSNIPLRRKTFYLIVTMNPILVAKISIFIKNFLRSYILRLKGLFLSNSMASS